MKRILLLILTVCLSGMFFLGCKDKTPKVPHFSEERVRQLDDIIQIKMQEMNLLGVVVAIWIPGEGEYFCAKGLANIETGIKRTLDAPFRIASITKTFIAMTIVKLIDEGKLNRSDTLSKFLPEFPNADKITIRNLLRMHSGIADFADTGFLKKIYDNPLAEFSAEDLINLSKDKADQFQDPGRTGRYCNANYVILGEIIKKVTGNEIGAQISESILTPLGMRHTIYPIHTMLPGSLHGYAWNAEKETFDDMTQLNPMWAGAAGAMISDIYDLKIFAKALYSGDLFTESSRKDRLETLQLEHAPDWIRYGEGILNIGSFWGHNGTIFGFSSEMWYLPEKDAIILINVNRLDADDESKSGDLFFDITRALFPEHVEW